MRLSLLALLLASNAALAQAPAKPAPAPPPPPAPAPAKKAPSKLTKVVKKLADTALTAAAGVAVDTLLGEKGRAVAGSLTGTGAAAVTACPPGTAPVAIGGAAGLAPGLIPGKASAGAAIVNLTKKTVKQASKDTSAAAALAAAQAQSAAAQYTCQPVGAGMSAAGMPGNPAGYPGAVPGGNALGAMAAVTPVGMAVAAAPLAGQAVKGLKGMFGGKPMDKIAILRELGKGRVELKGVKFIEGTAEMEPGYEPTFAALGEALPLAEGTYLVHVAAEQADKKTPPDTALARKRLEKVWAAMLVNGVSDQKIISAVTLPEALAQGRKAPKAGDAKVEIIRMPAQP